MTLALYRKYRPRVFAEVIGQEHVTEPLMQALRTGRLHHAYLFSGPRGCGKTSSARILARSLNCERGPTPDPCGTCESCRALAHDGPGSVDVIEIDAASHGGVDDARDLRERAFFAPVASRFKVYVIDEAHMVSPQGFNALLKLVEEPPEYVKFVFATTEPERVLGTIKSRTHHYPFRLIPPSVMRPYLEKVCREEGVQVEPAVFPLVVRAGGGSVRDSLSVLDQLIAGAGPEGVTYARAVSLLGVTDVALIDEMVDALAAGDGAAAFTTIDRVVEAGYEPRRFISDLLERLRDLIILQQVPDAATSGIIDAPADQLERMISQSTRMGPATLSRLADIAHNGLTEMRGTTAPRLLLELIVARMLLPGADDSQSALLQRLERMERRLGAASTGDAAFDRGAATSRHDTAPPAAEPQRASEPRRVVDARRAPASPAAAGRPPSPAEPAAQTSPAPVPQSAAGSLDAAAVRRVWDEVLTVVRRRSPRAGAVVREATVREVNGDELVLVFRYPAHANLFAAQADLLVEALGEVLGGSWRVRAELGGDQRPSPPERGAPPPAARARPTSSSLAPQPAPQDSDWPTPARPGGGAPATSTAGSAARPGGGSPTSTTPGIPARPSAAAPANSAFGTPAHAPMARDLGYDTPGFDPGDEPLDDDLDSDAVYETSEEQAIRLIEEELGAERIGESPAGT